MYSRKVIKNIGIVSTRLEGTDGVTLETAKWVEVLENMRFDCTFFSGLSDWDPSRSTVVPLASFQDPAILELQKHFFGTQTRKCELTDQVHDIRKELKQHLYDYVNQNDVQLLIIENALSIPLHIPLGIAITEVLAETDIPAVGHHHDFYWERDRFMVNCVNDYINMSFPPSLNSLIHVVINTEARKMLSYRRGLSSIVIPNVFDYSRKPPGIDDYNQDLPEKIGLESDDILFLQPTRIIQRKGIEHSIEIVHRLNNPRIKLLITHSMKDEGQSYCDRVLDYAKLLDVPVIIRPELFNHKREIDEAGNKKYSVWDIYPFADFVTYPSAYEGFGNAFLEAIFFRKPILVNRYSIYQQDIEPMGFDVVEMNHHIDQSVVDQIQSILDDDEKRETMVDHNYELAERYFSYELLEQKLKTVLLNFGQI
jgi:glycosyltransferase involved in cell wall biosynthesis